jgi:hypothetical protein
MMVTRMLLRQLIDMGVAEVTTQAVLGVESDELMSCGAVQRWPWP